MGCRRARETHCSRVMPKFCVKMEHSSQHFFIKKFFRKKKHIFQENCEKLLYQSMTFLRGRERLTVKNEVNLFYWKFGSEYFFIMQNNNKKISGTGSASEERYFGT